MGIVDLVKLITDASGKAGRKNVGNRVKSISGSEEYCACQLEIFGQGRVNKSWEKTDR